MGALFSSLSSSKPLSSSLEDATTFVLSPEQQHAIRNIITEEDTCKRQIVTELNIANDNMRELLRIIGPVKNADDLLPVQKAQWKLRRGDILRLQTEMLLCEHRESAANAINSMAREMRQTSEVNKVFSQLATSYNLLNAKKMRDEYMANNKHVSNTLNELQRTIFTQPTPGPTEKLTQHEPTAKFSGTDANEMMKDMRRMLPASTTTKKNKTKQLLQLPPPPSVPAPPQQRTTNLIKAGPPVDLIEGSKKKKKLTKAPTHGDKQLVKLDTFEEV